MNAEYLVLDRGREGERVERPLELLPQIDGIAPVALLEEAVLAVHAGALVVPPDQEERLRVLQLVAEQKDYALQRLGASVHVVAQKQVVLVRRETRVLQ